MKNYKTFSIIKLFICLFTIIFAVQSICMAKSLPTVEYEYTIPKPISGTLTEYTPWIYNLHLQSDAEKDVGMRGGETGQRIYAFAVSPFDSNYMVFGLDTTGIYMSVDGGKNWFVSTEGIEFQHCISLEYDPKHEGVVYAVAAAGFENTASDYVKSEEGRFVSGLYRSEDNGFSWSKVADGISRMISGGATKDNLVQFDDEGNIYTFFVDGVKKSTDMGETWKSLGNEIPEASDSTNNAFYVSENGKTIITGDSKRGIMVTFDGGKKWTRRGPYTEGDVCVYSIGVDPDDSTHWYATTGGTYKGHIFETRDSGAEWKDLGLIFQGWSNPFSQIKFGAKNKLGVRRMFISGEGVSRGQRYSDDGGKTWNQNWFYDKDGNSIGNPYFSYAYEFDPNDEKTIYFGCDEFVVVSHDNGDTWELIKQGFSGYCVRQFNFDANGYLQAAMHDFGFWRSDAPFKREGDDYPTVEIIDDTYLPRHNGAVTGGDMDVDPRDDKHIYAAVGSYGSMVICESNDGGYHWNKIPETAMGRIREVKFHSEDPTVIYSTYYTSYDDGETWQKNPCQIFNVCEKNNDYLVGYENHMIWLSKDRGATWITTPIEKSVNPWGIIFDMDSNDAAWVACEDGRVIKVQNGNARYYGKENGLGDERLYQIAQNPFNPGHMLACGTVINNKRGYGLFESTDYGETWHIVPGTPGPQCLYSVSFSPYERIAVVGSYMGTFVYEYDKFHEYLDKNGDVVNLEKAVNISDSGAEMLENNVDSYISKVEGVSASGKSAKICLDFKQRDIADDVKTATLSVTAKVYSGGTLNVYSYAGECENPQNISLITSSKVVYSAEQQRIKLDISDYINSIRGSGDAKIMLEYVVKNDRHGDNTKLMNVLNVGGGPYCPFITLGK